MNCYHHLFRAKPIKFRNVMDLAGAVALLVGLLAVVPVGQGQAIWYVDDDAPLGGNGATWATAFKYLQDGLVAADSDDEIRVAAGRYQPDLDEAGLVTRWDRDAAFELVSGVRLCGGYAGIGAADPDERDVTRFETILTGDLRGDDGPGFENYAENSRNVVFGEALNSGTLLDGVIVAGGNGGYYDIGGGLHLVGGRLTIVDCVFRANRAEWGGAIYTRAATTVIDCSFAQNLAYDGEGGAIIADQASLTLIECSFDRNEALVYPSQPWLGGGAVGALLTRIKATNCMFTGNTTPYTGGALNGLQSPTELTNCVFSGNHATDAGAVSLSGQQNSAINCVFYANTAAEDCGGLYCEADLAYTDVTNCIFWNNQDRGGTWGPAQIAGEFPYPPVSYCCIENYTGVYGDTGTTTEDPRLVDPDGADDVIGTPDDDLRVAAGSPCIDAGNNEAVPWDLDDLNGDGQIGERIPIDLAGSPRFLDDPDTPDSGVGIAPIIDMGPYEFVTPGLVSSAAEVRVPEGGTAAFTVELATPPDEPLTVTVTAIAGDPDITVRSGASLQFDSDNFDIPQPVTLAAALDDDDLAGETTIEVAAPGLAALLVFATEIDSDAVPTVLFVNAEASPGGDGTTWGTAFDDLQDALVAAATIAGQVEIWVALGTYPPDRGVGDPAATFELLDGVALLGGFVGDEVEPDQRDPLANRTVLSGDLGGDQYARHIVTATSVGATAILDGFEISQGHGDSGAGLLVTSASPAVRNCAFVDNTAGGSGGAVSSTFFGHPTFAGCIFINNHSSGQYGGAVYSLLADATLKDCVFIGNSARYGGAFEGVDGVFWLTNCRFLGNSAYGAGGAVELSSSETVFVNCAFSGNLGRGAVYNGYGRATLVNCDFSRNAERGLVVIRSGDAAIHNCILWGNSYEGSTDEDAQVHVDGSDATLDVQYSCIQGWTGLLGGIGNAGDDPLFTDADGDDDIAGTEDDDLHLASGSPCIDVGSNWLVLPDFTDLDDDGNLDEYTPLDLDREGRFFDDPNTPDGGGGVIAIVDMGAYEVGGTGDQFCMADLDGDREVGIGDLIIVITHYGTSAGARPCDGDIDFDGDVDLSDLAWLLPCYGGACDD